MNDLLQKIAVLAAVASILDREFYSRVSESFLDDDGLDSVSKLSILSLIKEGSHNVVSLNRMCVEPPQNLLHAAVRGDFTQLGLSASLVPDVTDEMRTGILMKIRGVLLQNIDAMAAEFAGAREVLLLLDESNILTAMRGDEIENLQNERPGFTNP